MKGNPAWKPGQSGNPGGRPKDTIAPLARAASAKAFKVLEKLLQSDDENIRLKAANAIIERGFGKPVQPVDAEVTGNLVMMGRVTVKGQALEFNIG